MSEWQGYISRFYNLPFEQRQLEWSTLTPDQRAAFEAEAKGLALGPLVPEASHGGVATLSSRAMAFVLDLLPAGGALVGSALLAARFEVVSYLGAALAVGYFLFRDALPGGRSLGKRACRIAVIHWTTGAPCSASQSLRRNLAHIGGVFDWGAALRASRRRIGDEVAKTSVVVVPP